MQPKFKIGSKVVLPEDQYGGQEFSIVTSIERERKEFGRIEYHVFVEWRKCNEEYLREPTQEEINTYYI